VPDAHARPAQLTMVVLDSPLLDTADQSLLGLPLGTGNLLTELMRPAAVAGCDRMLVVTPDEWAGQRSCRNGFAYSLPLEILSAREFAAFVDRMEPADYVLLVDPRFWPVAGYDFETIVGQSRAYRGAIHALTIGSDPGSLREQIDYDENGHVRRVQRLYTLMSWPETRATALLCSMVPARAIREGMPGSLGELREGLIRRGWFTQDVPVASDVYDLSTQEGILELNDLVTTQTAEEPAPPEWSHTEKGVLVGKHCQIHPSARIVPPVVIHANATIEAGATVVGPTIIGREGRVQRNSFVSRSVVGPGTVLPVGAAISRQVTLGQLPAFAEMVGDALLSAGFLCNESKGDLEESVCEVHRRNRAHFAVKRLMDITLSGLGLLALSPLLVLVAIITKLTSPGPIFFAHRRERMGERGDFPCLKFRTMVSDAHRQQREMYEQNQVDGPQFKIEHDPRITKFGAFLRKSNIDELPQLINVFLGHMSLVGPRPSPFRENQMCVPWRRARLSVRPGITGLWQLCRAERDAGDFHQWIQYDIAYVKHFSIWLDLKILFYTVMTKGGRDRVPASKLLPAEE
jgi:lipopolysaccharide/colanic/teichoic acid biosynthesis glycosyltransferase/acetyltransferase-like isoleucine patch superfamily enzyme